MRLEKQRTTQEAIRSQQTSVQSAQRRSDQRLRQACCQKAHKGNARTFLPAYGSTTVVCVTLMHEYA